MNAVQLFIENKEVQLSDNVSFAITKQFDTLSNPTLIVNDWSKTVDLPFSVKNNQIFNHLYDPHRLITASDNEFRTGVYFDPTRKLDFKLYYRGTLFMTGYAKMNSVKRSNGTGSYNITLNGQMGKLFQELKKLNFTSKDEYDLSDFFSSVINKELIYDSWTTLPNKALPLSTASINDIIGWAPTIHGLNPSFDSNTVELDNNKTESFKDMLENKYKTAQVDIDSVIGDGLTDRQYGEYRSYYQIPFIHTSRLFEILKLKTYELTGYSIYLDPDFFGVNNPYFNSTVMLLKQLENSNVDSKDYRYSPGIYTPSSSMTLAYYQNSDAHYSANTWNMKNDDYSQPFDVFRSETLSTMSQLQYWRFPKTVKSAKLKFKGVHLKLITTQDVTKNVYVNENNTLSFYVVFSDTPNANNSSNKIVKKLLTVKNSKSTKESDEPTILIDQLTEKSTNNAMAQTDCDDITIELDRADMEFLTAANEGDFRYLGFGFDVSDHTEAPLYSKVRPSSTNKSDIQSCTMDIHVDSFVIDYGTNEHRSNCIFDFGDLWDTKYNFFDTILNYTKMFGLVWELDDTNKTLRILSKKTYFNNYTVVDYTSKLDMSKDFEIRSVAADNKYLLFNYEKDETDLGEQYSKRFSVQYGEKKVNTDYAFNSDTKDLFTNLAPSLSATDRVLSWDRIHDIDLTHIQTNETMPYLRSENKQVSSFGKFFFFNGLHTFNSDLRSVTITDDSPRQQLNDSFMYLGTHDNPQYWHQQGLALDVNTYPCLSVAQDDKVMLFNVPSVSYDINYSYQNSKGIYDLYWDNYLNERYNIQTKLITCYLNLVPLDYMTFKFNRLVKIDNQLYIINKIYDYDVTVNTPTKCDIIKITDIKNYQ